MLSITTRQQRDTSNSEEFIKELNTALVSCCGVIYVKTRDWVPTVRSIMTWSYTNSFEFKLWSHITGWMHYASPEDLVAAKERKQHIALDYDLPRNVTANVLDVISALKVVYDDGRNPITPQVGANGGATNPLHLVPDCDRLNKCWVMLFPTGNTLENPVVQQYIRQQVRDAEVASKRLIIIESPYTRIPSAIESDIEIIDHKDPSHRELVTTWETTVSVYAEDQFSHITESDVEFIAQNAIGMTSIEFAKVINMSIQKFMNDLLVAKRVASPKTEPVLMPADYQQLTAQYLVQQITLAKTDILKRTDLLELIPATPIEKIGGLDALKTWLSERKVAFTEEAAAYGIDTPKGFLVVGVPGSGKSLIAKATSSILGVPCIRFDVGKVYGKYVGDSESSMRRALRMAEAMAPCVLFLDEVDKGFAGSSGELDSGSSARVLGTMLTCLQERKPSDNPVFVIMTANNVTGLPPELLRKGRLDEIFSVTFPTLEEREAIVRIHFESRGHKFDDDFYKEAARLTDRMVGAEIESVVKETLLECFRTQSKITTEVLEKHTKAPKMADTFAEKIKVMDDWAKANAKPASNLYNTPIVTSGGTIKVRPNGLRTKRINRGISRDIIN